MSHYTTLGVRSDAKPDEIKKAARLAFLRNNTDHGGGNAVVYAQTIEAFKVLSDVEARREYDSRLRIREGDGGRGGDRDGRELASTTPIATPRPPSTPAPIIKELTVTMEQVFAGTLLPIDIERHIATHPARTERETLYVTIERGVDDGEIVVIPEKGNIGEGGAKGDIRVHIKVLVIAGSPFRRVGIDLVFAHTLTLKEALCGFTLTVPHLSGKSFTINNQSGRVISHGYRQTLTGRGFVRGGYTGNFIIEWSVRFPERLGADAIEALRRVAF